MERSMAVRMRAKEAGSAKARRKIRSLGVSRVVIRERARLRMRSRARRRERRRSELAERRDWMVEVMSMMDKVGEDG